MARFKLHRGLTVTCSEIGNKNIPPTVMQNLKTMLPNENSILRYLPIELEKRQMLILDSIRFTLEMIDYSYNQLREKLLVTSKMKNRQYDLPELFIYAWSIVDNSKRFYSLYKKLPSNDNHKNVENLDFLRTFRNTYQHLDQRVDESILINEKPIYGSLKWLYTDLETKKTVFSLAISGINLGTKGHPLYPESKGNDKKEIDDIIIETVDNVEMKEINLSELYENLEVITSKLESKLKDQFKKFNANPVNWIKRKDIILFFKNEDNC
ncbi:hypothetical protein [Roseimarinus sediminis]|uniref:hypothetical protein n=1 Tax=Roseimarinus sediminis TaxID=1610899 RepID=UPI003D24A0ED